jgi:Kelch motif
MGRIAPRLMAAAMTVAALLGVDAGVASAAPSAPYFNALSASGATELQTARAGAVVATLPDGQVLIAGGYNFTSGDLQSAELFDPTSDTFTALPASGDSELQTARFEAAAATLPDGRVLIAGGYNFTSGDLQSAELFDPTSDTFTALPPSGNTELQTPREDAVAATLPDGRVLIAGGYNASGTLQSAELFDPTSDTFTALPASGNTELQTARGLAVAAVLHDGQVLIAGGGDNSGDDFQSAELFNPTSDTFTALPASGNTELQTARAGAVAATLPDGQVLIAGGGDNSGNAFQSAELFDPTSDTFSALPASGTTELQTARAEAVAAPLPDGQVLITGGFNPAGMLQSAELYNSAPELATAGGDFGAQTVGQSSAVQSLVLTNVGAQALMVSGAALDAAGDPGDFAIIGDACTGRTLALKQSCTITARFTPSAAGPRQATIDLSDNEPTDGTIGLSGTGVAPSTGPTGPPGVSGVTVVTVPSGPHGASGTPNQLELVLCRTVTHTVRLHGKTRTVTRQKCTATLVAGNAFTATTAKATLVRHGVIYATGTARLTRVTLHAGRRLVRPGEYMLTVTRQVGRRRLQTHQVITIG